jgi:recombination protein RecA
MRGRKRKITEIEPKYQEQSIVPAEEQIENLIDLSALSELETISTGYIGIDDILGGGVPAGKIIEILGEESVGKSTLWLSWARHWINDLDKTIMVVDAEKSLTKQAAIDIGIDISKKKLKILKELQISKVFSKIRAAIKQKIADIVVIDSISSLIPESQFQQNIRDVELSQQIGEFARKLGPELRMTIGVLDEYKVPLIIINQIRSAFIRGMIPTIIPTGGHALRHWCFISLQLEIEERKEDHQIVKIQTIKNKINIPLQTIYEKIIYGKGFSVAFDRVSHFIRKGYIEEAERGRYLYKGKKLFLSQLEEIAEKEGNKFCDFSLDKNKEKKDEET